MPGIHRFCDVGEKAYGSAMFLRWKLDDGSYTCVQLMALFVRKKLIDQSFKRGLAMHAFYFLIGAKVNGTSKNINTFRRIFERDSPVP